MPSKNQWDQAIQSVFAPQPKSVQNSDLAQYILTHTLNGPVKTLGNDLASKQGAESEQPGLLSRVFDAISTPLYATEGFVSDAIDAVNQRKKHPSNNPLTDIFGSIPAAGESLVKNIVGNAARSVEDVTAATGMATGMEHAPLLGKILGGVEKGTHNAAESLAPRATGASNLEKAGVKNPWAKYGLGFLADVALDPTTYLTLGAGAAGKASKFARPEFGFNAGKDANSALDAAAATGKPAGIFARPQTPNIPQSRPVAEQALGRNLVPQTPVPQIPNLRPNMRPSQALMAERGIENSPTDMAAMQAARRSDNAKRAANARWGKPLDWHDIPDMTPADKADFADMFRDGKLAKAGKVSDGKGNISNRAVTQVIADIKNGTVPRFASIPEAATGEAAARAQQVADKVAENLSKATRKGRSTKELTPADQANLYNSLRNAAAEMLNISTAAKTAEKADKPLSNVEQHYAKQIGQYAMSLGKSVPESKNAAIKYLDDMVKQKNLSKAQATRIRRKLFPSEPIQNPAVTRAGAAQVDALTRQMLRTAEDHLLNKGVQPVYWNGMRVRLSDVMQEIGPAAQGEYHTALMDAMMHSDTKRIGNPVVQEAINKALARRSLSMSDLLANLSQKTAEVKNSVLDKYPTPLAQKILDGLPDAAAEQGALRGATPAEVQAFRDQVGNIINIDKLPTEEVFVRLGDRLVHAVLNNQVSAEDAIKISNAVNKTLGESKASLMKDITGNKVVDGFFTRFSTYFGRIPEMKRFADDNFLFAELNAGYRAETLRQLAKKYTSDQIYRGFRLAQAGPKIIDAEMDQGAKEFAQVLDKYFGNMLSSTGFKDIVDPANTAAVRSGMVMTDINKHLKAIGSKFEFVDRKYKDEEGILRDFTSKGDGWLASWQRADPRISGQDPLSLIHDIDLAMQRTVAEYNLYDEFGRYFGAKVGQDGFDPAIHKEIIPHPRLKGLKFHPEVRKAFQRQINDIEQGAWRANTKATRMIAQSTRVWKSSVTIYYPIHHIRNLIGDSWNMWWAGINDPRVFTKAAKVLESQKMRYGEAIKSGNLDAIEALINKNALDAMSMGRKEASATDVIIKTKKGLKINSEQLWSSGFERGLFLNYNKIEDLYGQTPMGAIFKNTPEDSALRRLSAPFGGRAHHVAAKISEHREHYVRMAHYIGAVEKRLKSGRTDLQKIYDEAAHEVRKWHPDGSDLTRFEQQARILIPFYSWTRKEIPLLLQTLVQKPAKIAAFPRAERALAGGSGIDVNDQQGFLDPYPNDQLFPYWIRASGIGPIGDPESHSAVAKFWSKFAATSQGLNGPEGYTIINPSNPFQDVATQIFGFGRPQDSFRAISNSLNPGVQIPMNIMENQTFSGAPISKQSGGLGYGQYLASQIPQAGAFTRLTGVGADKKPDVTSQYTQNFINMLTALGIRGTGPYQKSAEFEAKDRKKYGS
jgi:hypothetical protein